MIEELERIPGVLFLLYYAALSAVAIFAARSWADADGSRQHPIPDVTQLDPPAIALLRGGPNAVIRVAAANLWMSDAIAIDGRKLSLREPDPRTSAIRRSASETLIEDELRRFLRVPRESSDLFRSYLPTEPSGSGLTDRVERLLAPLTDELRQLHLLRAGADRDRARKATMTAASVLVAVGGTKLLLGSVGQHPVLLLILAIAASVYVLYKVVDAPRTTALGRQYVRQLESSFGWLKESAAWVSPTSGITPGFAVAIFGIGLISNGKGDPFGVAFGKSGGGNGGGGCGGCDGGCGGCGGCGCG